MNVELPWFLFFLFLIAIPIVIHLLNFQRPKKLLFTRLDFIEKIEQKSKNVRSIKKWLILLSRIGLVVSLVLAFAVPFFTNEDKEEKTEEVYFVLDANQRMGQQLESSTVLAHTKSFLHKFLNENPLLTYKMATEQDVVRYESSAEYLNERIEKVTLSRKSITAPVEKIKQLEIGTENGTSPVFVVSDFNKVTNLKSLDTNQRITFVKMAKEIDRNVFVDSVYFTTTPENEFITVDLKSSGNVSKGVQVQLKIEGALQGAERCDIQKNGKVTLKFEYDSNQKTPRKAEINILDSDASYDNHFYFILPAKKSYRIGVIGRKQLLDNVGKLFELENDFEVLLWEHSTVDYQRLEKCQSLLFEISDDMTYNNSMVQKINSLGVSVILIPNQVVSVSNYQKIIRSLRFGYTTKGTAVSAELELDPVKKNSFFNPIFKAFDERVNMPKVTPFVNLGTTSKNILSQQTKGVLVGDNKGFVFGFDLVRNKTFFNHALSLPIFYEMLNTLNKSKNEVKYSRSVAQYMTYVDPTINIQNVKLGTLNKAFTKVQDKLVIDGMASVPQGFHELSVNDSVAEIIALNLPQSEGLVSFYSDEDLTQLIKNNKSWSFVNLKNQQDVENFIQSGGDELYPLWKYCVILALIFLFVEVVLIRIS